MAPKKKVSAAVHFEPKVCNPKYVKKANMFVVTEILKSGEQKLHWVGTDAEAKAKYASVKSAIEAAA